MSTLPPLAQVRGNATTPGRRSAAGSGESATSRGTPSASASRTSRTRVGCVQLPPSQPWKRPPSVTSARSPSRAEVAGSRRTTTASAKGSPFFTSSAARRRRSGRIVGLALPKIEGSIPGPDLPKVETYIPRGSPVNPRGRAVAFVDTPLTGRYSRTRPGERPEEHRAEARGRRLREELRRHQPPADPDRRPGRGRAVPVLLRRAVHP